MTKKHYIAAARAIKEQVWLSKSERELIANQFADFFENFSEKFNRYTFYKACGIEPNAEESIGYMQGKGAS